MARRHRERGTTMRLDSTDPIREMSVGTRTRTRARAFVVVAIAALVVAGGLVVPDQTAASAPEPPTTTPTDSPATTEVAEASPVEGADEESEVVAGEVVDEIGTPAPAPTAPASAPPTGGDRVAASAVPRVETADQPGVFYSNYAEGWVESISGPEHPVLLGSATAGPANYSPGTPVTVTVTVQYPIDHCEGTYGDGRPRSRDAGTESVAINWNGAELVSYGPTATDVFYVYHGTGGANWVIPISRGPADKFIQDGAQFTATFIAPDSDAVPNVSLRAQKLQADACTATLDSGDITLYGGGYPLGVGSDPTAAFTFAPSPDDSLEIVFSNTSIDPQEDPEDLAYLWDFDDGETSTEQHPTHRYSSPGTYTVTLRVTNSYGGVMETSREVVVERELALIVNSTGDSGDDDPANGCDTGAQIGDDPECTLRAALETVANDGGGEITFDIDGGGVPTIAVGSEPLPSVPGSTTIDGTSQPGGQVAVDGAGAGTTVLTVTGAGATVKGLVLDNATRGIRLALAEDAVVTENVIGADATGMTVGSVDLGVSVLASNGVTVSNNVIGAESGVGTDADSQDVKIIDNEIGVQKGGGAVLGSTSIGIASGAPLDVVSGNTVHGSTTGISLGSTAAGAEVRANRIGVAGAADVVLDGGGPGVVVEAPDAVVDGNVISSTYFGPSSFGSVTVGATATDVTITDNTIGNSAVTGGVDASGAVYGVLSKFEATNVGVIDNVIAGPEFGVHLIGGSGHSILDNRIGVDANGVSHPVTGLGVAIQDAAGSRVGAEGRGNTIHTANFGIGFVDSPDGFIVGNEVTATEEEASCLSVEEDSDDVTVEANTVVGCLQGITIKGVVDASVIRNVVQDPTVGILIEADSTTASTNIVLGAELQAIDVHAEDASLKDNLIGTTSKNGAIQPFDGEGIRFESGSGAVRNNVVVGAGHDALVVNTTGAVMLRGNRLEQIGQRPIVAPNGPNQPSIDAAIQSTAPDGSTRTTLVVSDLPKGDAGELEVFANDDCDPGEAHDVLGVVKTKKIDRTTMIVQLIDRDDDNFTATYTTSAGNTSELSACESITDYPDSDGDGSVDPIDDLTGGAGDATRGVLITDDAQILQVSTNPGRLTGLSTADDPAPGAHPGVDLPYGTVRFSVEGLTPGAAADVTFLVIDGDTMQPESTYWKYASPSPEAPPSWFDFSYDATTGLGAQTLDPIDIEGLGLRRPLQISFRDGALGDADEFPNGTIVDPGAIAVPNGTNPDDPSDPGGEQNPDPPAKDPVVQPVATPDALTQPAGTASGTASDTTPATLPRTGAPIIALLALGAALLALGTACRRAAINMATRSRF